MEMKMENKSSSVYLSNRSMEMMENENTILIFDFENVMQYIIFPYTYIHTYINVLKYILKARMHSGMVFACTYIWKENFVETQKRKK